jgi:hypothetical protein
MALQRRRRLAEEDAEMPGVRAGRRLAPRAAGRDRAVAVDPVERRARGEREGERDGVARRGDAAVRDSQFGALKRRPVGSAAATGPGLSPPSGRVASAAVSRACLSAAPAGPRAPALALADCGRVPGQGCRPWRNDGTAANPFVIGPPSAVQPLRWHTGERLAKRAHGVAHLVSVRAQPVDALSNRCLRPRGRSDPRDLGEVIKMSVAREEVQAVLEGQ